MMVNKPYFEMSQNYYKRQAFCGFNEKKDFSGRPLDVFLSKFDYVTFLSNKTEKYNDRLQLNVSLAPFLNNHLSPITSGLII